MDDEEWRPIVAVAEYEVSNLGRVRRNGRIKKPREDRKGYQFVVLWSHRKSRKYAVHRLVAEAFIGPRPEGLIVRHRNGINDDNRDSNLRYGTYAENEADKIEHGTNLYGEKHQQAKLSEEQVLEIRRRYKRGDRQNGGSALGREFGVSNVLIGYIMSGKLWSHL